MNQIEKIIDLPNWNRREHFEHFSAFDDPFFGVTVNVECTRSYQEAKSKDVSFFLLVLHRIITAAAEVEEFRYRIEGDQVVCYDSLFPEATVARPDHTFSFASFDYDPDEMGFIRKAKAEMERLQQTTGLNKEGTFHPNAIHYSAVPWLTFTDMKHPTNMRSGDSVPKISTGKFFKDGERLMLPISVTCHHGLMDGYHVSKFIEKLKL
ncbi:chloramphenicol acetyltransferase [Bacteroides reticulotermitis]|uniref:Chloramphenicol acetyltransferase n=2 Tax=Bacteroides reticulotermitis TaxID=1133319 RepID=W4US27_9BACE|nr:chloramphenicol acetyltransferase [Bacteroides reticulotermitis]MBB4043900.1 chloramphenicol O-acetyltransferase type A [Bacteroides reticulotermitis]GAE83413.1 chloramphenicol acetyltransferase [Bacteroides reticulotermitis JCM 10512]